MPTETAILGGGCFWCVEAAIQQLKGVESVRSGYMGGQTANPTYQQVCSGKTGHVEVAEVTFDPSVISFSDLLHVFFTLHDPTTLNRQGNDVGTQYRSAIFYYNDEQKVQAEAMIKRLTEEKVYSKPIVTEITPAAEFYSAEDYHQEYFNNNPHNPYCAVVIQPKLHKFAKEFAGKIK